MSKTISESPSMASVSADGYTAPPRHTLPTTHAAQYTPARTYGSFGQNRPARRIVIHDDLVHLELQNGPVGLGGLCT